MHVYVINVMKDVKHLILEIVQYVELMVRYIKYIFLN